MSNQFSLLAHVDVPSALYIARLYAFKLRSMGYRAFRLARFSHGGYRKIAKFNRFSPRANVDVTQRTILGVDYRKIAIFVVPSPERTGSGRSRSPWAWSSSGAAPRFTCAAPSWC